MKDEVEYKILDRLNAIVRLLALNVLKDEEFRDQVRILSDIGFQPKEIADILGKTSNNVSVTLHYIQRGEKTNPNKKAGVE